MCGSARRVASATAPRLAGLAAAFVSVFNRECFKNRCQGTRPMQYLGLVGMGYACAVEKRISTGARELSYPVNLIVGFYLGLFVSRLLGQKSTQEGFNQGSRYRTEGE